MKASFVFKASAKLDLNAQISVTVKLERKVRVIVIITPTLGTPLERNQV